MPDIDPALLEQSKQNVFLAKASELLNAVFEKTGLDKQAQKNALWPLTFGLAC